MKELRVWHILNFIMLLSLLRVPRGHLKYHLLREAFPGHPLCTSLHLHPCHTTESTCSSLGVYLSLPLECNFHGGRDFP